MFKRGWDLCDGKISLFAVHTLIIGLFEPGEEFHFQPHEIHFTPGEGTVVPESGNEFDLIPQRSVGIEFRFR